MQYVVRSHIPLDELPLITKATDWPVFFASAMYVFEGIALVCDLKKLKIQNFDCLGFTSPTKNERTGSVWWLEWSIKYGDLSCNYIIFFCWIFWLHSIWFRCTWID
jgi:hypothetical protein